MASIICRNGAEHRHSSVVESKVCFGLISYAHVTPVSYTVTAPVSRATPKQIAYVERLKGDAHHAHSLSIAECSKYIDDLKKRKPVTAPQRSPKTALALAMLEAVPDGYFAVQPEEGASVTFLRVARPTNGQYRNSLKVQTQHGPTLDNALVFRPDSDRLWVRHGANPKLEEDLLLLVADWRGSAMRYARLIGKCMRCNLALTDERSRHYGIGPDCEKVWTWVIPQVDASSGR